MNEMNKVLTGFLKKILFGQMGHFGPKNSTSHNFESTPIIFLKFCIMIGANSYMKVILMVFTKKFLFKEMDHFGLENGTSS